MARGLLCYSVALALLVVMNIPSSHCAPWWSMLSKVRYSEVSRLWWTKERCRVRFNTSLNEQQLNALCDDCPMLVPTVISGAWSAIVQCQLVFKNSKWRCGVYERGPYFGRFIEEGTRETAFLSAILSAGIVEKVAQARLVRAGCDNGEGVGSTNDIIYPMDDDDSNIDYAVKFVEAFTESLDHIKGVDSDASVTSGRTISSTNGDAITTTTSSGTLSRVKPEENYTPSGDGDIFSGEINYYSSGDVYIYSNDPAIKLMESHNNKVGRELMKKYYNPLWQPCYGEECAKRPLEQIKEQLFKAYSDAVQVEELDGRLKGSTVPDFTDSQLVYLKQSPNLCQRNITYGIEGTSGRQCYPENVDSSSCDSMCCGSSVDMRVEKKLRTCKCNFVWCCHVKCQTCAEIVTNYYCN